MTLPSSRSRQPKQRHGIEVGIGKRLQPLAGLLEELRLAPREACCGERQNREETGIGRTPLKPAAEQIDLLLNGQEAADLMEERFEILLIEAAGLIAISIAASKPPRATTNSSSSVKPR